MARVRFTIGSASFANRDRTLTWFWSSGGGHVLPSSWFANPNEPEADRDLRQILINGASAVNLDLRFGRTSRDPTGDLSSSVEASGRLLTFEAPGWGPYTFVGPANSGASRRDTSEPYAWSDSNYSRANISTIANAYAALSSSAKNQTTITFDDGVPTEVELAVGMTVPVPVLAASLEKQGRPVNLAVGMTAPTPSMATELETKVSRDFEFWIFCGVHSSGLTGWWFNNIGRTSPNRGGGHVDAVYELENGDEAIVRQTMTGGFIGQSLRFVINQTITNVDQLPPQIITTQEFVGGTTSITWERPGSFLAVGQGTGANYTTTQGSLINSLFANQNWLKITLVDVLPEKDIDLTVNMAFRPPVMAVELIAFGDKSLALPLKKNRAFPTL